MTGQTFTAHPKVDPEDRQHDRASAMPPRACAATTAPIYEITPSGELIRELWFKAPYYCMMHDFAITAGLRAVPHRALDRQLGTPAAGAAALRLRHHAAGVSRACCRGAPAPRAQDIRWFKRDNCFASHVLNAFQDGTKIHFDTPEAKNNMFPFFPDVHGAPFNGAGGHELPDALDRRHGVQVRRTSPASSASPTPPPSSRASTTASPACRTGTAGCWRWTCAGRWSCAAAAPAACS